MRIVFVLFYLLFLKEVSAQEITFPYASLIDSLKPGDTLLLKANISSCGEWGSHNEYFRIFYRNSNLSYSYFRAGTRCLWDKEPRTKSFSSEGELKEKEIEYIREYLTSIQAFQNPPNIEGNGSNYYYIVYRKNIISRKDIIGEWQGYAQMCKRVLHQE